MSHRDHSFCKTASLFISSDDIFNSRLSRLIILLYIFNLFEIIDKFLRLFCRHTKTSYCHAFSLWLAYMSINPDSNDKPAELLLKKIIEEKQWLVGKLLFNYPTVRFDRN